MADEDRGGGALAEAGAPIAATRRFGGHPIGLTVLIGSTVWESFALASMRAGLVYYIVDELHVAQSTAVEIYGYTTAGTFLMALVGATLADRLLGLRRATALGALMMAVGLFILVQPRLLFPALFVVAVGNGLFKPTALAQVGLLYAEHDPRRDRAFNLYYMGMNLGAIIAPLVCGVVAQLYGWTQAFLAAAVGMLVSVAIYWLGRRLVPEARHERAAQTRSAPVGEPAAPVSVAFVVAALVWIGAVLFWSAYSQIGGAFALWVEHGVARSVSLFGRTVIVPAAWLQSVNPILILLIAPLVNVAWARSKGEGGTRTEIRKMAQGAAMLAVAFLIFAGAAAVAAKTHAEAGLGVVLLGILPFTVGELFLAPVGQAFFSRLAKPGNASVLMAVWILTMMMGYLASGTLGGLWARSSPAAFFAGMAGLALASAAVLTVARRRAGSRLSRTPV